MFGKTTLVIAIFALELSPCCCQFGGGEMMGGGMGEMMAGGMGGLGAMMGGMGGMMGGMGGGMGGMGGGIGSMIRQGMMAGAMNTINDAVHFIVGPQANPDQTLINFAMGERGPPRSMSAMFRYLPHFQRIARQTYGPMLAEFATQPIASSSSNTTANAASTNSTGGITLAKVEEELDAFILQKAIQYMDRQQTQGPPAPNMASMGMMIPQMIQRITAAHMQ